MSNKLIRVNINHHGFIASLGCYGPVKNILLNERQINNIKRILGEDKVQLVNPPKKVISPKQAEEMRRVKQKPVMVKPEEIVEIIEVKPEEPKKVEPEVVEEVQPQPEEVPVEEPKEEIQVEEQPKPTPKRRGGRKPAPKKVEEVPAEEPVEE